MNKKILFVTATHGNEPMCVEVAEKIKKTKLKFFFDLLIANPEALKENKRYIDADLNRIFPGKINGNYEERQAQQIINIGKNYDYVIDLHGSVSKTGIFIIITKFTLANVLLALKFNIKKIIIWPNAKETNGSLSTFMPIGIEIESGLKTDPKIKRQLFNILIKFLNEKDAAFNINKRLRTKEIYLVSGKLTKNKKRPKNLKNWKKVNDYYPIFADGQYKNIWCYKLKKIDLLKDDLNI